MSLTTFGDWTSIPKKLVAVAFAASVCFFTVTYALAMILGLYIFLFTPEGLAVTGETLGGLPIFLFFVAYVFIPTPVNVGLLFAALWSFFFLCLASAWKGPVLSFPKAVLGSLKLQTGRLLRNYLFSFTLLTCMLVLTETLVEQLQEAVGIPTGAIEGPDQYMLFFTASYASVFEEVGFRVIPLGLVVALTILWPRHAATTAVTPRPRVKVILWAFLYPEGAKRSAGLEGVWSAGLVRGIGRAEWIMVILSGVIFGLVHVLFGGGWGAGKFTLAFMVGIVSAVTYLVFGIAAPILIHWFHNYYLTAYSLAYNIMPQPFPPIFDTIELAIYTLGALGWVAIAFHLLNNWQEASRSKRGLH